MKNTQLFLLTLGTATLIGGCTPTVAKRGNIIEDYQLSEVVEGVHTRKDVLRIMGSPTTRAPFDENTWYYIGQYTEKRGILDPEITDERIIIVTFNNKGIVDTITEKEKGRIAIPIAREKTQTHGNELTVMQQLLGNMGKFNTEGFE